MTFYTKNSRILCPVIDIWNYFAKRNYTYAEVEQVLRILISHCRQTKQEQEYATIDDFMHYHKTKDVSNTAVTRLRHIKIK